MLGENHINIHFGKNYPFLCKTICNINKIKTVKKGLTANPNGISLYNWEEYIKFIFNDEIEQLKIEFINKNHMNDVKQVFSNDRTFAKVLDNILQTNLYHAITTNYTTEKCDLETIDNICIQAQYENWTDFIKCKNMGKEIKNICEHLDYHLCLNTFICLNTLTLSDLFLFFEMYKYFNTASAQYAQYTNSYKHISRWFRLIENLLHCEGDKELYKYLKQSQETKKGNITKDSSSVVHQVKKNKNVATSYEGKLENAEKGKVVTRFPPEPSGFLHIGHAKAAFLNSYYANLYEGKMLLRFDDTNPALEDIKYEHSIIEDLNKLELKYEKISYTSQYFDLLEQYCIDLIKMNKAYADDTNVDDMRLQRGEGIESFNRNIPIEKSLQLFQEMQKGTEIGQKNCIRAKINMQSKNKCMRDPVLYRCIPDIPHHKYGLKYKCYPTYDFACPIIDSIEGVTHALRTNEYSDRIEQYNWVLETLKLRKVHIYEFSRISFVRTVMSKRKLKWFVENNIVEGWDDPRMPTIKGILRRGLCKEALFQFILEQGPSKSGNLMQWDKLWSINKQIIDPIIPRYAAVSKNGVHIKLTDLDNSIREKQRDLHLKNKELGSCKLFYTNDILIEMEDALTLTKGEEITIIKLGNIIITDIIKKENNQLEITAKTKFDGDFKATKKKIHWVAFIPDKLVHCILYEYDHLITVDKFDTDDKTDWKTYVNYNSKFETEVFADPELIHVKAMEKLQFERRGYFIVDKIENNIFYLIKIPDGKAKNMSIISSKVDAKNLAGTKDKSKPSEKRQEQKRHNK